MHKRILTSLVLVSFSLLISLASDFTVTSPNGRLTAIVEDNGALMFSVRLDGVALMSPSFIGLTLADGTTIGRNGHIGFMRKSVVTDDTDAPFYRQRHIHTTYDEGVAYRFYTTRKGETVIKNEVAEYDFGSDAKGWLAYSTNKEKPFAMAFQNTYDVTPLSQAQETPVFLPVTIEKDGCVNAKVTILESDLRQYPGMFVAVKGGACRMSARRRNSLPSRRVQEPIPGACLP